MSRLRFNITMTLDGYIAGPKQSLDQPLGERAERLHDWAIKVKTFHEMHGEPGGERGPNDDVLRQTFDNIGATIMGRNMFGGGPGPWREPPWQGWWGENPPYHTPVFILTHHPRDPLVMQGDTTFHFVTDGIESALAQARQAAAGKDVALIGGARAAQQYLAAGLVDEIELHLVPMLLGAGERLFDNAGLDLKLEPIRVIDTPEVTHLKYRIVK